MKPSRPLMAQSGHGAMSARRPLSGVNRKFDLETITSAFDPERTWGPSMTRAGLHRLFVR
jgi:hypothetical protein